MSKKSTEYSSDAIKPSLELSPAACALRRQALAEELEQQSFSAALLTEPGHLFYFTGYHPNVYHTAALLLLPNGRYRLIIPNGVTPPAGIEDVDIIETSQQATLIDHPWQLVQAIVRKHMAGVIPAMDGTAAAGSTGDSCNQLGEILLKLRRSKHIDELGLIMMALHGADALYEEAGRIIADGTREIDMFAALHAASVQAVGEPIAHLGNDFQSGSPGGPPRTRPMQNGETIPLDISVIVRSYRCDLCRTYVVGDEPSDAQIDAITRVTDVLNELETSLTPGMSCKMLYDTAFSKLDGYNGWSFPHHLGHGFGLSPHETPRLNPAWPDDHLLPGDVFTLEPGLYGDKIRGGVRIERNYLVTNDKVIRLDKVRDNTVTLS